MTTQTVINIIPREIVQIIPYFTGDKRQLNLFLRKCQYVIDSYSSVKEEQNVYVFNIITSRLTENAAALLSERDDILTWSALKALLIQHFGDPRSEACINIELESLKIKSGENYLDFCNRIQSVRSLLISKVNANVESDLKKAKLIIYDNTALNVFLYNLPENLVRIVRLKAPSTLEAALSVVLEEVNFMEQYNMRNRIHGNNQGSTLGSRPLVSQGQPMGYKPMLGSNGNNVTPKFNFGIPQNAQIRTPQFQGQGQGNFVTRPPSFGYRPQYSFPPQHFGLPRFGLQPQQAFGYRPPQQFGYKVPQPFGYRPPQPFGYKPNLPALGPPNIPPQGQRPQLQSADVSMRTAPQRPPQNGFRINEITTNDHEYGDTGMPTTAFYNDDAYYDSNCDGYDYGNTNEIYYGYDDPSSLLPLPSSENNVTENIEKTESNAENNLDFCITASDAKKS